MEQFKRFHCWTRHIDCLGETSTKIAPLITRLIVCLNARQLQLKWLSNSWNARQLLLFWNIAIGNGIYWKYSPLWLSLCDLLYFVCTRFHDSFFGIIINVNYTWLIASEKRRLSLSVSISSLFIGYFTKGLPLSQILFRAWLKHFTEWFKHQTWNSVFFCALSFLSEI